MDFPTPKESKKTIKDIDHENGMRYEITRQMDDNIIHIEIKSLDKKGVWKYESGCFLDLNALRYLVK